MDRAEKISERERMKEKEEKKESEREGEKRRRRDEMRNEDRIIKKARGSVSSAKMCMCAEGGNEEACVHANQQVDFNVG